MQSYSDLSPSTILNAVEAAGFEPDGRITALNSYENRVYQLGQVSGGLIVAKFYRPGRWSDATILEEHGFAQELAEAELPVVAPHELANGSTLLHHAEHRLTVFPSIGGRPPALDQSEDLRQMGRLLARIHNVGATHPFEHRASLSPARLAAEAVEQVNRRQLVPDHLTESWHNLSEVITQRIRQRMEEAGPLRTLRIHGDSHPGNVLWRDDGPWVLDLDDAVNGPAIQDLWMYLSGDREYQSARLHELLEGYSSFRSFDPRELYVIEALRAMRMLYFLGWIAGRWDDPAFPQAFPDFAEPRYWDRQILGLQEQLAALDESPLVWQGAGF
ncbi:Ser/Thr protein kinase RdoA (MazF antagonist) [Natronospira proteinivora]|uniref:Stress response kinase A n=1 Tax=Natronospira proteinivora TaxID=1807133 RepID=A0ABT1G6T7_9GAMM|nr:serine/threonine protein kinase [Natronospira proteinivora]MCP1727019.1 Ser/Thr protein kinase RdoA (MazF antagonist) [Natronospira proteinivora]